MKYRFFDPQHGEKRYLMPRRGGNNGPAEYCLDRQSAGLFTEADWQEWGGYNLEREPIAEDEAMHIAGASMLPGLEAVARAGGE